MANDDEPREISDDFDPLIYDDSSCDSTDSVCSQHLNEKLDHCYQHPFMHP